MLKLTPRNKNFDKNIVSKMFETEEKSKSLPKYSPK